jgi:hypothetical protein
MYKIGVQNFGGGALRYLSPPYSSSLPKVVGSKEESSLVKNLNCFKKEKERRKFVYHGLTKVRLFVCNKK